MTIDDLALTLHPELGCRTAIHLLECFGSAEAVFAASAGELVCAAASTIRRPNGSWRFANATASGPLRQAMSRIRGGCSSVPIIRM